MYTYIYMHTYKQHTCRGGVAGGCVTVGRGGGGIGEGKWGRQTSGIRPSTSPCFVFAYACSLALFPRGRVYTLCHVAVFTLPRGTVYTAEVYTLPWCNASRVGRWHRTQSMFFFLCAKRKAFLYRLLSV